jgi:hypothetical protein
MRTWSMLSVLVMACGSAGEVDAGGGDSGVADAGARFPGCDAGVTFQQVLTQNLSTCGSTAGGPLRGCHQITPAAGGLDLRPATAWAALVSVPSVAAPNKLRVKPGAPFESFLYQKLTNTQATSEGEPMPKGEGILWHLPPDAELERVRCWINRGAPND